MRTRSPSRFFADLHVHSRHSRACSRDCDLEHLALWAARKGIGVVGTGDFTHPVWAEELRTKLVPAEPGLFRLRDDLQREVLRMLPESVRTVPRFMLSTEISTIYKRDGHTRKVHHLLYAPDLDAVGAITAKLARIGNLHSDGRPILGLDSRDLLEITLAAGDDCYLVPAHVWTPWFAVLGSKSGFDAVEDCYADLADHVFALETGLSADPPMFWRISGLDRYRLVGNSDAHSPPMLGRETTFFDTEVDYFAIRRALRTGEGFGGSAEFFPEEGKYHLDGHRGCGVRLTPEQTGQLGGDCPVCHRPVTVGVLNRVASLADREEGYRPPTAGEVISLVSLPEIVGEIVGVGPKSKAVALQVNELVARLGPELGILTAVPLDAIAAAGSSALVEAIARLRRREVIREAGFDGEYGVIRMFEPKELAEPSATLFDLAPQPAAGPSRAAGSGRPRGGPRRASWRSALAGESPVTATAAGGGATPVGRGVPAGLIPVPTHPGDAVLPGTLEAGPGPDDPVGAGAVNGPSVLDGLDPDQRVAAAVAAGPLLIVAGPGTGKTRTLVHAVAHRVREAGVPPSECLAVTFTRRARDEIADRLTGLAGTAAEQVTVATFHGLGLRIVRECHERLARGPGVAVAEDAQRVDLLREAFAGGLDTPTAVRRAAHDIGVLKRARA
ncbi:MAG: UvrD-helicase domain-containing protein, partial [Frankia sp.]